MRDDELKAFFDVLHEFNIKNIDTARIYVDSEKRLGEIGASSSFIIDTKAPAFAPKAHSKQSIVSGVDESLRLLKTDKVDVYYLHAPDPITPIEETVDTIQEMHRHGKFSRFGLSNFLPEDVEKIYNYAKSTGGVVPSVYQGNYNAFARTIETSLFPVLRKLNMAFYAYSPLAGGFFAKHPSQIEGKSDTGRFDPSTHLGDMYNTLYNRPVMIGALNRWREIASSTGESSVMLAYRWVVFHSALDAHLGDAVILGASRASQLEQTLKGLEAGQLPSETVREIEELWKAIASDAPLDNFHSYAKEKMAL